MADSDLFAARFVSYLLLLLTAGLPLHALFDRQPRPAAAMRMVLVTTAFAAMAASAWWGLANVAAMAGVAVGDLDRATVFAVLGATPLGMVLTVRAIALTLFIALLALRPAPGLLVPAVLTALGTVAWTGHSGADGGLLLRIGDLLHVGAAALWLGALFAFLGQLADRASQARVAHSLARFARTGTLLVAILLVTGCLDAALITGFTFPRGTWAALIALKATLFAAMLGFAAHNRWRLVPALEHGGTSAVLRLRRSVAMETCCALAIVAVVAIAGQLDPAG